MCRHIESIQSVSVSRPLRFSALQAKLADLLLFFFFSFFEMNAYIFFLTFAASFCIVLGSLPGDADELCTQNRRGCKIEGSQCVCGYGCYTEYRYNNKNECYKAMKGKETDMCQRNPCKNGGTCSQTSHDPGFRCRCEGTGYYGQRCQYACPKLSHNLQRAFPYECIVI